MQAQFFKSSTLSAVEMPLVEELRHRARQWVKRHARVTRGQWVDVVSVNGLTFDAWALLLRCRSLKNYATVHVNG